MNKLKMCRKNKRKKKVDEKMGNSKFSPALSPFVFVLHIILFLHYFHVVHAHNPYFSHTLILSYKSVGKKGKEDSLTKVFSELRKKKYWQVEFEEVVFDRTGVLSRVQGTIKFVSPFTFEISYEGGKKRVLSDGELLFFVFPDKRKVFVKSITDEVSQNLIFDILAGTLDVSRYFSVERKDKEVFLLFPKENVFSDKLGKIKIRIMRLGFPIRSVEITHKSGNMGVRLELKKVRYRKESIIFSFPDDYNFVFDINLSPKLIEKLKRR